MKLRRLELQAFGHFSGHTLEFAHPEYGFHLIYGPNEAGKSTALRAVRGLLFGIPQLSGDTFLHDGKNLRLGGEVCAQSGAEELSLRFVRRKGRKNTLLSPAGEALSELELRPFLGGADLGLYSAMFGLDHESLRDGAQALLSGEGKVGESLFGASVGTGSVRTLLLQLRSQADQLFTPKGRSGKRINQGISDVRAARQKVQLSSTTASGYLAQRSKLSSVSEEISRVKQLRSTSRVKRERLERQLRVLPLLARRDSLAAQRSELGDLPVLPADIKERRERAVSLLEENRQKAEFESAEIERLQQRLQSLDVQQELLALDESLISELSQRLGQYRKARLDLPKREGELAQKQEDARDLLKSLGHPADLSACEQLRLSRSDELQLRRLNEERTRYDTTLQERARKLKEAQNRATWRRKELQQAPEIRKVGALSRALKRALGQLVLAQRAADAHARAAQLTPHIERAYAATGSLTASLSELLKLSSPPRSQLEALAEEWAANKRAQEEAHEQLSVQSQKEVALTRQVEEMQALGEVPSLTGLAELRAQRDQLAAAHQESIAALHSAPHPGAVSKLETSWAVYQTARGRADDYVDRLRVEAARAAKLAALRAELNAAAASQALASAEESRLLQAEQKLLEQHAELWRGQLSHPLRPAEMLNWLDARQQVIELVEQKRLAGEEAKELEHQVAQAMGDLAQELVALGEPDRMLWESLPQLVERAEAVLDDITQKNNKRKEAEQRLESANGPTEEAEAALAEHKEAGKVGRVQWQKALKNLGLSREAGPDEVNAMLDGLGELFHRLEEIRGLERRIAGMKRDGEQLASELKKLFAEVLPAALELDLEAGAELLLRQHRCVCEDAKEQRRLNDELQVRQANVGRYKLGLTRAEKAVAELLRAAGVSELSQLVALERQVTLLDQLRIQIAENEADILAQGEGLTLAQMFAEAQTTTAERNRQLISELEPEIDAAEKRLEALMNERANLEQLLSQLEGGAAEAAEELAASTASLKHDVQTYVRLRLAEQILSQEVEQYRAEHQGPVLRAASEMFPQLTLGRYTGLSVGFDKRDEQILQCVRPDGREVPVSGLSDGTRDQLYLSLRLATLERYLEHNAALPLVLDDILVHFDDERAKAALSVLGDISRRTQVLFFTHHRRLAELAVQTISEGQLRLHELPAPSSSTSADEFSTLAASL